MINGGLRIIGYSLFIGLFLAQTIPIWSQWQTYVKTKENVQFQNRGDSKYTDQNYNLADKIKMIEFEVLQYPDLMSEWHDYEISPRNSELPVDCSESGAPAATASAAHRRRLSAAASACGCVNLAALEAAVEDIGHRRVLAGGGGDDTITIIEEEVLPAACGCVQVTDTSGGGHRRRILAGGAAEDAHGATETPVDCESIIAETPASSGGHRRRLFYRNLAGAAVPAADEVVGEEGEVGQEAALAEEDHHIVTLEEVVADTASYYDEYK